ncbi:hypothetical protein CT0861_09099 [Colletotrichum tofieldiae]|uniref:Uncharacterized protein n=1 Tax=Colletotrichum tofieldiae TaxID=708197 RepID=A0A166Y2L5_9PEZI|nr:hypothetical protein CT0861_09099 [Colletotrichum tofieldiae]
MHYHGLISLTIAALTVASKGSIISRRTKVSCLCEDEAWDITRRWLGLFSTDGLSSKEELATVVSPNIKSYDNTFVPVVTGIDELWEVITEPGNRTTTNETQTPSFLLHSCDQIAFNWKYTAVTTGYNSTVPVGTPVYVTGNDILRVDLETGLVSNATASGDWILLARQLGGTCSI